MRTKCKKYINFLVKRDNIAYPYDTSQVLSNLIDNYNCTNTHQVVSFRDMVFWLNQKERATHYIHSYPGKLLPHIAHFFLSAYSFFPENSLILDPFSGTGTITLEAYLSGRNSLYADSNPIARLITSSKTNSIDIKILENIVKKIKIFYKSNKKYVIPDVINIKYWFTNKIINKLSKIKTALDGIEDSNEKDFLLVTFSSIIKKLSLADPRLSVPVHRYDDFNLNPNEDVIDIFNQQVLVNLKRYKSFVDISSIGLTSQCVGDDAKHLKIPGHWNNIQNRKLSKNSIDIIITSPPYAGAQKYIRATGLNIGWLGLSTATELIELDRKNIGSERLKKSDYSELKLTNINAADLKLKKLFKISQERTAIVSNYINDMKIVIDEMHRILKINGVVLIIIGNNTVCGETFKSSTYLLEYFQEKGFNIELLLTDKIKSWSLMTKRNVTANIITHERIMMLRKRK
jgi:DNA modification methylase